MTDRAVGLLGHGPKIWQNEPLYFACASPLTRSGGVLRTAMEPTPPPAPRWFIPTENTGESTTVAVKIRLKRLGKIRAPFYRVVVTDALKKRDGRVIEEIGKYHPTEEPSFIDIDGERARYWLGVGAQPSEQVLALLKVTGDWQAFKGLPGAEGTLKRKEADTADAQEAVKAAEADAELRKAKAAEAKSDAEKKADEQSESADEEAAPAESENAETSEASE